MTDSRENRAAPDLKVKGVRWGGCLLNTGEPAVYVVALNAKGEEVMFFCRADLRDMIKTHEDLRRAML